MGGDEPSELSHTVAVASEVDKVMERQPVDEGSGHELVTEDIAPVLEAPVRREHGGRSLAAAALESKEEHGSGACDACSRSRPWREGPEGDRCGSRVGCLGLLGAVTTSDRVL